MSVLIQLLPLCFIYNVKSNLKVEGQNVYVWVIKNAQTLSQAITFAFCISLKNKILCVTGSYCQANDVRVSQLFKDLFCHARLLLYFVFPFICK